MKFNSDQNPSSIVEGLEAKYRLGAGLYSSVILLHHVVQILTTADLDRIFPPVIEFVADGHSA
jgi:hypothetical protein